jgi:uncharacterized protein YjbI with pentapeptide repeats
MNRLLRPPLLGRLVIGMGWSLALLATLALIPAPLRDQASRTARPLADAVWQARWTWPIVAAATLTILRSPRARRRRPPKTGRIPRGLATAIGLLGLTSLMIARPRDVLLSLGVAVIVGLLATWVLIVPRRLAPPLPTAVLDRVGDDYQRLELAEARLKRQNDVRTTALQAIAGLAAVLAVLAGALVAFQQLTEDRQQAAADRELTRQGQASERFTRAIDQLGSSRREVELGGIYGLEQTARQAPENRLAVTEVLVAYLHRRAVQPANLAAGPRQELRSRAPDVQAVLTVIARRQTAPTDPRLDLRSLSLTIADLRDADLRDADLSYTDLSYTDLSGATLVGADLAATTLRDADLSGADLSGVNLGGVNLTRVKLGRANLSHASLWDANFRDADLRGANLSSADLRYARLQAATLSGATLVGADLAATTLRDADLRGANLSGANFRGANLSGASLGGVDLRGVKLGGATLRQAFLAGADLRGADLRSTTLGGANLLDASADRQTQWPRGFDWRAAGVRLR